MTEQSERQLYADVIVDITHERLDRVYQYAVPAALREEIHPGVCVDVPFGRGNRRTRAYVIAVGETADVEPERIKELAGLSEKGMTIESKLIRLAAWMRRMYGATMIQALRTVLPVKEREARLVQKQIVLAVDRGTAEAQLAEARRKHHAAKERLLEQLLETPVIDRSDAAGRLGIGASTLSALARDGVIRIGEQQITRDPAVLREEPQERKGPAGFEAAGKAASAGGAVLTEAQRAAAEQIVRNWETRPEQPSLIEGVTGSGKTLVYMELAERVLRQGRQVIILIPEIALSWQIVRRFRRRFGDIVTVLHSRMGRSERFDQYEKMRRGEAQIVIGPRSALFTPFSNPGLIIIDEEQEGAYRSEETPRYDARETAIERARIEQAHVVMGSATPSVDSYARCMDGTYFHVRLPERYGTAQLPAVQIVDMRQELRAGNRGMLSRALQEAVGQRLARREQTMLFLNKRGLTGFLSCRSCGSVLKCPHCDVSLTAHRNGMLICHYCNFRMRQVDACPVCGSPHLYGFRAGTQKAEDAVHQLFPVARILRMDADSTRGKEGHDRILRAFAAHEADILIGTQMIVKGHDFPDVTLVGVLLADLSLYASDYRAAEHTYQLTVQAIGRAGRGSVPGTAVIQTYAPAHYSIQAAAVQDYAAFYEQEMTVRRLMQYPPAAHLLTIHASCRDEQQLLHAVSYMRQFLERIQGARQVHIIGPAPEAIARVQEYYRQAISLKSEDAGALQQMRRQLEAYIEINSGFRDIRVQYDLDC